MSRAANDQRHGSQLAKPYRFGDNPKVTVSITLRPARRLTLSPPLMVVGPTVLN